ncbi:hypothetical protein ADUPG1_007641, partial [Aduncisulcus paluster]
MHDSPGSTNEPLLPPDVNPPPSSLLHAQHTLQHTDADILISDQQTLQSDDTQTVQQEHTQRPTANDITPTTHTATGDASRDSATAQEDRISNSYIPRASEQDRYSNSTLITTIDSVSSQQELDAVFNSMIQEGKMRMQLRH